MVGIDFSYNGKNLSDFGFIMANPDNDDNFGLEREIISGEVTSVRKEANHYGTKYSGVIILNMFILKYGDKNRDFVITMEETRAIQSWLTSATLPKTLNLINEDGTCIEYHGLFTNIEPFIYYGLDGFYLTFTCNSPFAYQKFAVKMTASGTKELLCKTDEIDYVYPKLTFSNVASEKITITNTNEDNASMSLTLNKSYSSYIIDCKYKRILADNNALTMDDVGLGLETVTDYNNVNTGIYKVYWLRLLPGNNIITYSGSSDLLIEYYVPLKLGGYQYV